MKIVIAPDSFKGSCSSLEVANYVEKGVLKVFSDSTIKKLSVADGGEGTVEAILQSTQGNLIYEKVTGPLGNKVNASYGLLKNNTAIIEMATASGLPLLKEEEKDALFTTTYGTGELILSALNKGCKNIIIGLGGSATTDGGVGMAQALGFSFLDSNGIELEFGGGNLLNLESIDIKNVDPRIKNTIFTAACDVTNPLLGNNGAAYIYGPQKGATEKMVDILDRGLELLSNKAIEQLSKNESNKPGSGAAGGLGFGILTFLSGTLKSGINTVLDAIDFDSHISNADLIITGEGRIDCQSINGKVPVGIGERALKYNIPLLVLVGGIGDKINEVYDYGIDSVMSIVNAPMTLQEAINNSEYLIQDAAERACRIIKIGMKIKNK